MADTGFDTLFPSLTGVIDLVVNDPDGNPNSVLEIDRSFSTDVDWRLKGPNADTIDGYWYLTVSVESMGAGFEGKIAGPIEYELDTTMEADSTSTNLHWHKSLLIPANTIPTEGVYKVVALLTYKNELKKPRPMAGFIESPLVSFYKPD